MQKTVTATVFRRSTSCLKRQAGFSLIEVMVAALVLSIGLIGLAGLQAVSLRQNQSAFMRSQVSAMVYDLADRMRANVSGATSNFYNPSMAGVTDNCSSTTGCSPQQMAQNDLAEWNAHIVTYLPMGQGFVCVDSTPIDGTDFDDPQCDGAGTQISIKIWWDDDRDGVINITETNTERFVISFQL